jgi:hypothetical protein
MVAEFSGIAPFVDWEALKLPGTAESHGTALGMALVHFVAGEKFKKTIQARPPGKGINLHYGVNEIYLLRTGKVIQGRNGRRNLYARPIDGPDPKNTEKDGHGMIEEADTVDLTSSDLRELGVTLVVNGWLEKKHVTAGHAAVLRQAGAGGVAAAAPSPAVHVPAGGGVGVSSGVEPQQAIREAQQMIRDGQMAASEPMQDQIQVETVSFKVPGKKMNYQEARS